jgi:IS1 family transposase
MNRLNAARQVQIVKALCEGNSLRSTSRMTGVAINTVIKLLTDLGSACLDYQDVTMHNLPCKTLQCDEIWSFVYAKQKNVPEEMKGTFGVGDVWTWTAIDADTKLIPCWYVGNRSGDAAAYFISDLAARLANRVQLTTDGHKAYLRAVEDAFGADIDYAMLIKLYGPDPSAERRYSPPVCIGTDTEVITGDPDPALISTSYVERQNLTMRMSMRRFTRLTNAFSKKLENHMHALALHFMWYNFARPHQTLSKPYPTTPAMATGLTNHVWKAEEILALLPKSN